MLALSENSRNYGTVKVDKYESNTTTHLIKFHIKPWNINTPGSEWCSGVVNNGSEKDRRFETARYVLIFKLYLSSGHD